MSDGLISRPSQRSRGTILIIAMIVLFSIAALVLTLGRTARTEALTAANARATAEADAVERGAEQYAMATLAGYPTSLQTLGDDYFSSIQVGNGYFWITRPNYDDDTISTYGVLDESSKLNLNKVTEEQLSLLPFMTTDLANDILAWRGDSGSNGSASSGQVKGQDFETVDEMRLLPDMTAELLYGQSSTGGAGTDSAALNVNTDWYQQHGMFDYFTIWSTSSTTAADGTTRISIDQDHVQQLNQMLTDKISRGPVSGLRGPQDIFWLANNLNLTEDEFSKIEDFVTSGVAPAAPGATTTPPSGLVNPNFAAPEVLTALGLSDTDVQQLISARANAASSYPNSLAWVWDTLKTDSLGLNLGRILTAHGSQYSADIVAASGDGRAFKRVRVVIDTSATPMKIVYRRDISDRGWPLDQSILQSLRSGRYQSSSMSASGGLTQ